jgi:hypothetical protein
MFSAVQKERKVTALPQLCDAQLKRAAAGAG